MIDWIGVDMPKGTCSIEGCTKPGPFVRGWCPTHYYRWRHHGDATYEPRPVIEGFWDKVDRSGDCWEWTGCRDRYGYGIINVKIGGKHRRRRASRIAYETTNGPIPDGFCILHSCDNPPCVRPDHLRAGPQSENMRDMRMRHRASHGIEHVHAKLNDDAVRQIRSERQAGFTLENIAKTHGVAVATVNHVLKGLTWKHVT